MCCLGISRAVYFTFWVMRLYVSATCVYEGTQAGNIICINAGLVSARPRSWGERVGGPGLWARQVGLAGLCSSLFLPGLGFLSLFLEFIFFSLIFLYFLFLPVSLVSFFSSHSLFLWLFLLSVVLCLFFLSYSIALLIFYLFSILYPLLISSLSPSLSLVTPLSLFLIGRKFCSVSRRVLWFMSRRRESPEFP